MIEHGWFPVSWVVSSKAPFQFHLFKSLAFLLLFGTILYPCYAGVAPEIDEQPASINCAKGDYIVLETRAHGDPQIGFQWQLNGTNISGGTNFTLSGFASTFFSLILTNAQPTNTGNYRLIVTNQFGAATSTVARVIVSSQIHSVWASSASGPLLSNVYYQPVMALDKAGNAIVSGNATDATGSSNNFMTVKFDPNGHQQWSAIYAGTGTNMVAGDMALDSVGNVYLTATSQGTNWSYEFATLKYDANGTQQWMTPFQGTNGSINLSWKIGVDNSGNVFVGGVSYDGPSAISNSRYLLVKYDSAGLEMWRAFSQYQNSSIPGTPPAGIGGLALDPSGDVYVTGSLRTIKYDPGGIELWNSGVYGLKVKTDAAGNIYVLEGVYHTGTHEDYTVTMYDANGNRLWSATYASPGSTDDNANFFAIGTDGSIYVTGETALSYNHDFLTVKFDPNGRFLWAARFHAAGILTAGGLAVDGAGNAYITGTSAYGIGGDITTVSYDSNGNQRWVARYNTPRGIIQGSAVALGSQTNVLVTGITVLEPGVSLQYTTVSYEQDAVPGLPTITTPPQRQSAFTGSNVAFNVSATGGPFNFQWRFFGTNLPAATNATLALTNVQPLNGGDYSVSVENGTDLTISPEARLTLFTQLLSPTAMVGGQFNFNLVGEADRLYDIQQSSNLLNWISVTNLSNTNGFVPFTAPFTNSGGTFYRAEKIP